MSGLATVVALGVVLVLLIDASATLPFSLVIAWAFFIWRAHGAWQRHEARTGTASGPG
jgi:hypothetical protein